VWVWVQLSLPLDVDHENLPNQTDVLLDRLHLGVFGVFGVLGEFVVL
jgi:hypothetical protein